MYHIHGVTMAPGISVSPSTNHRRHGRARRLECAAHAALLRQWAVGRWLHGLLVAQLQLVLVMIPYNSCILSSHVGMMWSYHVDICVLNHLQGLLKWYWDHQLMVMMAAIVRGPADSSKCSHGYVAWPSSTSWWSISFGLGWLVVQWWVSNPTMDYLITTSVGEYLPTITIYQILSLMKIYHYYRYLSPSIIEISISMVMNK